MERPPAPLLGVVGPTASGKTDLALSLAGRLPVELLVADSRQVVRHMDVGTAKPDARARRAVPHHLLDLADPDQPFSVALWVDAARRAADDVVARGRLPMLVGGTGLYVEALLAGHDYGAQGWSPETRERLAERLDAEGSEPLAAELSAVDPDLAARTDLHNPRRVLRALERVLGGGAVSAGEPWPGRVALVGLSRPRDELYRRIDVRARWLFTEGGLLDEVRALQAAGYGPELRPMSGHGYREAAAVLAGNLALADAIETTARRTRQYAKRQLSWFRREPRIMWISAGAREANDPAVVDEAERLLRAALS